MAGKQTARYLGMSVLGAVLLAVVVYNSVLPEKRLPSAGGAKIDVTPREVAAIPPGTVIAGRPPEGWSHLIIKSQPRVGAETRDQISGFYARLAGLLFTAILADVEETRDPDHPSAYCLANVAIGAGTEVNGRDVILSPDTQQRLGADLGFWERRTLSGGLKELHKMRCTARSRTMAILDSPGVLIRGNKHRRVVLRYAILVDPKTGRLDTLLWTIESEGHDPPAEAVGPMQWLPPNKVEDCVLHVDSSEFILGIPNSMGFAMTRIPQGRRTLAFPGALKSAAAQSPLTPDSAEQLEEQLGSLLSLERASQ